MMIWLTATIMAGLHAFVKAKANSGSAVEIEMNEPAPEVPGLLSCWHFKPHYIIGASECQGSTY